MNRLAAPPLLQAAAWMVGALFSFMAIAIGGRELSQQLDTFEILFYRSLIGLIVVVGLLAKSGWQQIRTQQLGLHLGRNLAHYGGQFGWFYGLAVIPLAEVFALEFTVPLWTTLLASILLKEKITRSRLTAVMLGFLGVLIILRPGILVINPASMAVLGAAVGYAMSHTLTRKLAQTDTPLTILFYMTLIQLPFGIIPAVRNWGSLTGIGWFWILVVGLTALTAHFCMTKAFQLADATLVVPMDFLRLPLIAVVGALFYAEPIDQFVLFGAFLMLIGNSLNLRAEQKKKPVAVKK